MTLPSDLLEAAPQPASGGRSLGPDGQADMKVIIAGCQQEPERMRNLAPELVKPIATLAYVQAAELIADDIAAGN